jgi:hypothetical protein
MHDPAETLQAGASGIEEAGSACTARGTEATSTGKRTVAAIDDGPSPDRGRCHRGAEVRERDEAFCLAWASCDWRWRS